MSQPNARVSCALDTIVKLDRIWGSARVGLSLTSGFLSGEACAAKQIVEATNLPAETVRRRLNDLVNIGRAKRVRRGRRVVYLANPKFARQTDQLISQLSG